MSKHFTALVILCMVVALGYGWVNNIILLIKHGNSIDLEAIVRIIGIFLAPAGAVLGLM